jgi:hypothetical protein
VLTEMYSLDPSLAEDVEEAVHHDDRTALWDAFLRLGRAVKEAQGTD